MIKYAFQGTEQMVWVRYSYTQTMGLKEFKQANDSLKISFGGDKNREENGLVNLKTIQKNPN